MKTLLLFSFLLLSAVSYSQSRDSVQYAEITAQGITIDQKTVNEKFEIYFNSYTETAAPKKLPYTYPIDALNYLAKQGWRCYSIFSVNIGDATEVRHYELERK